ncbi:MAG: hybrid sensor histidine kinase/response regulator [Desulfovibrio sp.]|nr:MAG: hybrid sensor histidine kinase/response regulator [Desulfovibrio sp.]
MIHIGVINLCGLAAALAGVVILLMRQGRLRGKASVVLILAMLLWASFHSLSNSLEWLGVTAALDAFEDYFQVMTPAFWGFFFYALLVKAQVITRRENELRLRESEERLSLAVKGANIGLWDWWVQTGDLFINEQWAAMVGYSKQELMPANIDTWKDLTHPGDLAEAERLIQQHFQGETEYYEAEIRMRHKHGHWVWILVRGQLFLRGQDNLPLRMSGVHQDISKRKLAEEATRDEAARRKVLMDTTKDGIAIFNLEHTVVDSNQGFADMLGYSLDEVVGMHTWDWDANMTKEELLANFSEFKSIRTTFESRHRRKDGSIYDAEISASGAIVGGEPFVLTIIRDITERKAMEKSLLLAKDQAEAANRAKSEFLANMSHEIRTPLNGIFGMHQLLLTTPLNLEQQDYVNNAIQSSQRLARLLTDILDLSRVEAGKLTLYEEPFDVGHTVQRICSQFSSTAAKTGVELACEIDPGLPQQLLGDGARVQQVLTNLVDNALKFTGAGKVTLEVIFLSAHAQEQLRVLFIVTDTGLGIADEKIDSLFAPFTQVSEGFTRDQQGAGLGLSICKHLVLLMGGSMDLASESGKGTSVYICLPFKPSHPTLIRTTLVEESEKSPLQAHSALVVEDDWINQFAIAKQLRNLGLSVVTAANGKEALDTLKHGQYDLVFMDIQMPVMNGIEATRAIRGGQAGEENKDIPIIALTAYAMAGDKERLLAENIDAYLSKPLEIEKLFEALDAISSRFQ